MSKFIPYKLFNSLPVGCPVRVERERRKARYVSTDELGWVQARVDNQVHSFDPAEVWVDVTRSDGDIRAYVPDLIVAVAGLPEGARPFKEVVALWDDHYKDYALIDYLAARGAIGYRLAGDPITGKTREECLLNGLLAALKEARQ